MIHGSSLKSLDGLCWAGGRSSGKGRAGPGYWSQGKGLQLIFEN